jgi:hypothetical protein
MLTMPLCLQHACHCWLTAWSTTVHGLAQERHRCRPTYAVAGQKSHAGLNHWPLVREAQRRVSEPWSRSCTNAMWKWNYIAVRLASLTMPCSALLGKVLLWSWGMFSGLGMNALVLPQVARADPYAGLVNVLDLGLDNQVRVWGSKAHMNGRGPGAHTDIAGSPRAAAAVVAVMAAPPPRTMVYDELCIVLQIHPPDKWDVAARLVRCCWMCHFAINSLITCILPLTSLQPPM